MTAQAQHFDPNAQDNRIITLTDRAKQHIQKMIAKEGGQYLRIYVKRMGCSGYGYMTDIISESSRGDISCTFDDLTIFIEPKTVPFIKGSDIDFIAKELGQKVLVFNNPNEKGQCGCGESFYLDDEESASE